MDNATIIRSDYAGPGQGAIVFEGINSNTGEPYQVVWSPGFDLESWFYDNGGASNPPSFYTSDQQAATYQAVCFTTGTLIATPFGQRRIEDLRPGNLVTTLDHGPRPVLWIGEKMVLGGGNCAPVVIQPGRLGNSRPLVVSQQHRILLASPLAELHFGQSQVWVPAKALINNMDITATPRHSVTYYHLLMAGHEVLLADDVATESLFLGDVTRKLLDPGETAEVAAFFPEVVKTANASAMTTARLDLTMREARFLCRIMGLYDRTAQHQPTARMVA